MGLPASLTYTDPSAQPLMYRLAVHRFILRIRLADRNTTVNTSTPWI